MDSGLPQEHNPNCDILEEAEGHTSTPQLSSDYMQATQRNPNEDEMVLGTEAARKVKEELEEMKRKVKSLESELGDQVHEKRKCLEQAEKKYVKEKAALERQLIDVQGKLKETNRELERKTSELRVKEDKMNKDIEDAIAKQEKEKAKYEQKITELEERNKVAEAQQEKWKLQFQEAEEKDKRSQSEIKTLKLRIDELEKELGEWKVTEKRKRSVNEPPSTPDEETDWKLKAEQAEKKYQKSQAEIKDLKAKLKDLESKLENSKLQNKILQLECENERNRFAAEIEQMAYDIRNARTEKIMQELDTQKEECDKLKKQRDAHAAEIEHLKEQLAKTKIDS